MYIAITHTSSFIHLLKYIRESMQSISIFFDVLNATNSTTSNQCESLGHISS